MTQGWGVALSPFIFWVYTGVLSLLFERSVAFASDKVLRVFYILSKF